MDAIDQVFAEFQLLYSNQYHRAFSTTDKLSYAKRLWFSHLNKYSAKQILDAAHKATRETEFLPSVASVLKHIDDNKPVLPLLIDAPQASTLSKEQKMAAIAKLRRDTGL